MERLILFLLSPVIFAEPLKINDPNDEPFLPIYPSYPYNPKLIKRGAERELVSQLTPGSYEAPKEDARDPYGTGYSDNYQRDSYYPNYDPYPKNTSPSPTYMYYNEDPYAYTGSPYATYNPYPTPYTVNPAAYPTSSYPDYYYQPSYYYPHYYNHALFPPPPMPPPPPPSESVDYHETSQDPAETEDDKRDKENWGKKTKEDEMGQNASAGQFVDGGNYISGNTRDLDVQSSTYKVASPYNQLEKDVRPESPSIPLPKTTYRVISVAGQPVAPDYPLPAQYVKAQQMEQLMSDTFATLLAQNVQQQTDHPYSKDTLSGVNDESHGNQDTYNPNTSHSDTDAQPYVAGVRTKAGGAAYVVNSEGIAKVNGEGASPQVSSSQITSSKNTKYPGNLYIRKPATQTTLELSKTTYVPQQSKRSKQHRDRVVDSQPADQSGEYDAYDALQSYTSTLSPFGNKREQSYRKHQKQADSYRSKDFVASPQLPQAYSYQYSSYETDQPRQLQDSVKSADGNFGVKRYNKS
ncbi:PREDICTED: uncharacterized protein LOC106740900 [Dinoponera quadriceps]|uniref:Uncharacterized protein LOC106740900 n=1 Tax=Dinoponera quadriceps TaxID=609295 RepID=A0A6P3WP81_DINQU|nr:PREDICTED: uncharacterized protein LOC106740900 [Dinoponera quadriceps]